MKSDKTYLGAGVPSVLITLIILLIGCFAALTFVSASSEMKLSEKSATYCDDYYCAETIATEILSMLSDNDFDEKKEIVKDKSGNLVYNSLQGNIVISRNDNNATFVVHVNKKQALNVEARITDESIDIIEWVVR